MPISPDRLRGLRHGRRLSRAKVAAAIERSPETVRAYEEGRLTPPPAVLPVLAGVLGVPVEHLHSRHVDPLSDYADAIAECTGPLSEEQLSGAVAVLRAIGGRIYVQTDDQAVAS